LTFKVLRLAPITFLLAKACVSEVTESDELGARPETVTVPVELVDPS